MRLPVPFRLEGDHIAVDLPGARALFTTRRGGVSEGAFASLNLGRTAAAEPDDPGRVAGNRARLAAAIGIPEERFAWGRQVHGPTVERQGSPPRLGMEADGQVTSAAGVAAMVLVADCLPIALAAPGAVAMVHAGWRGLAGGVVEEGIAALRELDPGGPVHAAIGPGAGGCCYEVGAEVADALGVEAAPTIDLKAVARARLDAAGASEVHDVDLCTICSDPGLFFSHRRDGERTGRQAGVVWRA